MAIQRSKRRRRPPSVSRPRRSEAAKKSVAPPTAAQTESRRIAIEAARAALDKKASAVEVVELRGLVDYADFLVLVTGQTDRHTSAIADAVGSALRALGHRPISVEGLPAARWVLLDFVDVIVHVFQSETRALYDIGGLFMDAERVRVDDAPQSA